MTWSEHQFSDRETWAMFILLKNFYIDSTIGYAEAKNPDHEPDEEELEALSYMVLNHGWVMRN